VRMERVAIYPGAFDPPTNGHLDTVTRASRLFDRVVVGVGTKLVKRPLFDDDERVELMRDVCESLPNVVVQRLEDLSVDFARTVGARFIIRSLRALSDFEFEFEMTIMNRGLAPELETVFLMTSPENLFLSSARVKELAVFGSAIDGLVPPQIAQKILRKFVRGVETQRASKQRVSTPLSKKRMQSSPLSSFDK